MGNRNKKIAPVELRQHKNCVDGMIVTARNSSCEKNHCVLIFLKEALINSTNEMKCEAHGTQQPGPINLIGEGVSTAQRSNSLVQSINQHFLNLERSFAVNIIDL